VVRALTSFKYDGVTRLARRMAWVMAARVPDPSVSLIVPVPLHRRRLRARGFNQSALLARHLWRLLRRPVRTNVVFRIHDAPSQTTRSGAERRRGTAGAFRVARPAAVRDRRALVVDDVWTSGATARAVAAALRAAGALSVDVVTFARVVGARTAR
jgi:ComF family protein